jgi:hypothetical protein
MAVAIHGAQRFDALAHLGRGALGFLAGLGIGNGVVRGGQFLDRAVQIACG